MYFCWLLWRHKSIQVVWFCRKESDNQSRCSICQEWIMGWNCRHKYQYCVECRQWWYSGGSSSNTTCNSTGRSTVDSHDTMTWFNTRNIITSHSSSYANKHTKRTTYSIKQFIEVDIDRTNKDNQYVWDIWSWKTKFILSLCIIFSNIWSSNIWGSCQRRSMGTIHGWINRVQLEKPNIGVGRCTKR